MDGENVSGRAMGVSSMERSVAKLSWRSGVYGERENERCVSKLGRSGIGCSAFSVRWELKLGRPARSVVKLGSEERGVAYDAPGERWVLKLMVGYERGVV